MNKNQILVFILTFLAYAALHSLRQGWSLTKARIKDIPQLNVDKQYLGLVDTCYLLSYSFGMMTLGNFVHKIQLKYFLTIGMILSSVFYIWVALFYDMTGQFNRVAIIIFMSLNGYFQCTGWPGAIGIMGNWFQKGKTGLILGIWAINANVGNIIAELMCNILDAEFNASWVFNIYSTGIFTIVVTILILLLLKDKPQKKQSNCSSIIVVENPLMVEGQEKDESIITNQQQVKDDIPQTSSSKDLQENNKQKLSEQDPKPRQLNIFQSLCFPKVPSYVIGYAMLKGCIYGLLFWLPTYLSQRNLQSQSGYIAAMVDTGSFIGGLAIGHLGDKLQYRALFLSPLLFVSSVLMFCSAFFLTDIAWEYYFSMFFVGITIGGPYNIIGAVITIDLGRQAKKLGGSTAAISALIQGTAAIFAAGSQQIIALLSEDFTFYIFFGECLIAAIVLFPLFLSDWKLYKEGLNTKKQLVQQTS